MTACVFVSTIYFGLCNFISSMRLMRLMYLEVEMSQSSQFMTKLCHDGLVIFELCLELKTNK